MYEEEFSSKIASVLKSIGIGPVSGQRQSVLSTSVLNQFIRVHDITNFFLQLMRLLFL